MLEQSNSLQSLGLTHPVPCLCVCMRVGTSMHTCVCVVYVYMHWWWGTEEGWCWFLICRPQAVFESYQQPPHCTSTSSCPAGSGKLSLQNGSLSLPPLPFLICQNKNSGNQQHHCVFLAKKWVGVDRTAKDR